MSYTPEEYAAAAARATAEQKELLIVGGELVLQEPAPRPLAELRQEAAATLWANYKRHQQQYVDAEIGRAHV